MVTLKHLSQQRTLNTMNTFIKQKAYQNKHSLEPNHSRLIRKTQDITPKNIIITRNETKEKTDFILIPMLLCYIQVFLPYPYSRSIQVQWRVFEKLFTDFRDCFNQVDYYDVLACAKNKFQPIPSLWLGY